MTCSLIIINLYYIYGCLELMVLIMEGNIPPSHSSLARIYIQIAQAEYSWSTDISDYYSYWQWRCRGLAHRGGAQSMSMNSIYHLWLNTASLWDVYTKSHLNIHVLCQTDWPIDLIERKKILIQNIFDRPILNLFSCCTVGPNIANVPVSCNISKRYMEPPLYLCT